MRIGRLCAVFLYLTILSRAVSAHPAPFSYVDVELGRNVISVSVVMHAFDVGHELGLASEDVVFEAGFTQTHADALNKLVLSRLVVETDGKPIGLTPVDASVLPDRRAVRVRFHADVNASRGLDVRARLFPYDPAHQTFLNIYEDGKLTAQSVLDAGQPQAPHYMGTQSAFEVVRRFVLAGIEHIAIGPDHILFLVGLLLLGGSVWQLLKIVTAFTVAHSITLTLAALNLYSPSTRIVEPAIALSIIYVGIDNLLVKPGSRDTRVWIALTFGLIHGFGFASVLREMDLPRRALGWSLFSFNLGVEIGQVCIVLIVASLLAWIAARSTALRMRVAYAGSVVVAVAGIVWFVQRVFFVAGGA